MRREILITFMAIAAMFVLTLVMVLTGSAGMALQSIRHILSWAALIVIPTLAALLIYTTYLRKTGGKHVDSESDQAGDVKDNFSV